ncbi:hypothetical protein [Niabella hibiscisoli]|uniref:hypothetical protein n=1 Tax=Niabella hibiscisoli TaxID=1825928 RepID=UPI001F0D4075|nr:hypothetical protein [Niabella hibiscisoli]MCH5719388.1 hypothetical protein [Niabella hibiscisoli]
MKISRALIACMSMIIAASSCNSSADKKSTAGEDSLVVLSRHAEADTPSVITVKDTVPSKDSVAIRVADQLGKVLVKKDLALLNSDDRKFTYTAIDLNGDNKNEIFVAMKGSYFCGNAGCTVYLLNNHAEKINSFTIVNGPIIIGPGKTKGWNDLIIPSGGKTYRVKFNGNAYPSNPSLQPEYNETATALSPLVLADTLPVHIF